MVVSFSGTFLAIDWGTTNRRVFLVEGGQVVRTERDDRGVTSVSDFAAEAAGIRERFGDLPMLMAGMVGSNIGWQAAPYVPAPAGVEDLAANLLRIDARTAIVPGVSVTGPADVMRGEEVQLLGAVAAGLVPHDALLAQPGTHCKWALMEGGRIAGFTTAMTGELFAMLRKYGLLSSQLTEEVTLGQAFLDGVEEGRKRDLAASLFGIRAAKLLGEREDTDAASFASGLLIGSDVAARLERVGHDTVHILADPVLGGLYAAAIEVHGRRAVRVDSHAAFVAGIIAIGSIM
ncbi:MULTISPECIES: 2-dehydro-3-deoxygalactonokinase [unclassified Sphingomonas]|uniref:2-dehydro-3-deoxygalactonokinase n=1 Tax=unclassified Sphingomonas TaxID=196159 RepID=UPI0022B3F7E2|nr:2-dehydro-3-deoxygalactonokinase [Sphingomonas sp. NIBR02145]WHU05271.1 2-dehydro-3-deoxygalactonokinase [Sphingomonas sp. NIBR02145]